MQIFVLPFLASELMVPPGAQSQVLDGDGEGGKRKSGDAGAGAVDTHYIIKKLDEFLSEKLHPPSSEEDNDSSWEGQLSQWVMFEYGTISSC